MLLAFVVTNINFANYFITFADDDCARFDTFVFLKTKSYLFLKRFAIAKCVDNWRNFSFLLGSSVKHLRVASAIYASLFFENTICKRPKFQL